MSRFESFHQRLVEQGARGPFELGVVFCLRLLAVIYGLAVWLRGLSFTLGLRGIYRSSLPVISVGNLAVGGTGKTPLVDLLIRYFQQQEVRVAVVSRGYGGSYTGEVGIVCRGEGPLLSAAEAGDEPFLLARRNPRAIVLVAAKRRLALEYLEKQNLADLVILDDGFQHRQVVRDLNLVLLDAKRPFGNRRLLPAGLLREPKSALARADLICLTGSGDDFVDPEVGKPLVRVGSRLAQLVVSLSGESRSLAELVPLKVVAFAGIGRPERFFSALGNVGIHPLAALSLGDHVVYSSAVIQQINLAADEADILLTTEKDAVKLFAEGFALPCYSVGLDLFMTDGQALFQRLDQLLEKEKSMALSNELLEILACPKCKGPISLQPLGDAEAIFCAECRLAYPVRDGIPVMLIDEAVSLGE